jgi:glucose/mannose transport system substrate-binding protein
VRSAVVTRKERHLSPRPAFERRSIGGVVLGLCLTLSAAACRSDTTAPGAGRGADQGRDLVEIFSWWSAPGEADALEALIDTHQTTHPRARIFNAAAASGSNARERLEVRLANNQPPDIFQEYIHDLRALASHATENHILLDDLFDRLGLRSVVFPEILHDVTRDGHIYAMPVNIHRENALFYNRRLLAAHHVAVPTTLDELLIACRALKRAGVIPMATAGQGWILRIMFNSLAMGKMGSAGYRDYFMGQGPADGGRLREAIDVFAEVVENYINPDAGDDGFGWTNAAQTVVDGDAAMILHGDWTKGYFTQLGWSGETDFGVVGAPGASDMFLYGVDAFALARGGRNELGARNFLATVASPAGQVAFNRIKGSSPIRPDVPRSELDLLGRETLDDLEHAKIRMLVRSRPVWEEALADFTRDHDRARLLRAFLDNPPGA